jgi:hypothetical protein
MMMLGMEGMQALSLSIDVRYRRRSRVICKLRLLFEMVESGSAHGQDTGRGSFALRAGACQSVRGGVAGASERDTEHGGPGSGVGSDKGISSPCDDEEFSLL